MVVNRTRNFSRRSSYASSGSVFTFLMPPRVPSMLALRALRAQISSPLPNCSYCESSTALRESNGSHAVSSRLLTARDGSIPGRPARRTLSQAATSAPRAPLHAARSIRRPLSRVAPVTSVNAMQRAPTPLKELHGALKDLEQSAVNYTNQTQLELALRGLESEEPTIRVAGTECPQYISSGANSPQC